MTVLRFSIAILFWSTGMIPLDAKEQTGDGPVQPDTVVLSPPRRVSDVSVEEALRRRRSIREFGTNDPLTMEEASQLLWAAQGVTSDDGLRSAPSAGALFPLELYLVAGNVRGLDAGIYRYLPHAHALERVQRGDMRRELARAALGQEQVADAPAILVFAAVYERTTRKYRDRGRGYVLMEAGHASENVFLQAVALGLATVPVGAFNDDEVKRTVGLRNDEEAMYLMPVGRPRSRPAKHD